MKIVLVCVSKTSTNVIRIHRIFEGTPHNSSPGRTDIEGQVLVNLSIGQTFFLDTSASEIFRPFSSIEGVVKHLNTWDRINPRLGHKRLREITIEVKEFNIPRQRPTNMLDPNGNMPILIEAGWKLGDGN